MNEKLMVKVFQQFFLHEVIYETLNHGLTKLISLAYQVFKSTLMILRAPYPENDNPRYKIKKSRKKLQCRSLFFDKVAG